MRTGALSGLSSFCRRSLAAPLAAGACALSLFSAGCARGQSAEDRQMAAMSESIEGIQDDNDHYAKRLTSADMEASALPPEPPRTPSVAGPLKAPSQRTVNLNPDGTEQLQASSETSGIGADDPDDTAPRPSIKISGIPGVRGKRGATANMQQIEENIPDDGPNGGQAGPPIQPGAARPSALDPAAKPAYDAALALVNSKQYPQALDALAAFLVKWPDHPNADNAIYWRGECYFAQGEYAKAVEQFEGLISRFPLGNKVPDALLKLGISQDKLGNPQKAAQAYQRLKQDFPRSEATRRIKQQTGDAPAPRREVNR